MNKIFHIALSITLLLSSLTAAPFEAEGSNPAASIEVLFSNGDGIVLEVRAPGYQLQEGSLAGEPYDQITVAGAEVSNLPGKPKLPVLNALIGIPAEAELEIEILEVEKVDLPGSYSLAPGPKPLRPEKDLEPGKFTAVPDEEIYGMDTLYPDSPVRIEEAGWLRDQRIARITFYPLQYNPARGSLRWHPALRVQVSYGDGQAGGREEMQLDGGNLKLKQSGGGLNPFEAVLENALLNYETAKAWRSLETLEAEGGAANLGMQSPALKITVDHDGLYQITYSDLQDAGLNLAEVDPRNFHLSNQGQQVAFTVDGEEDGVFHPEDTITFYGEGFRGNRLAEIYANEDEHWLNQFVYQPDNSYVAFDAQLNATMFEKYTEKNVYWLTVEETPGLRISTSNGKPAGGGETPNTYWETVHREESHIWWSWHFTDEDTWLWDEVVASSSIPVTRTYTATLSAVASGPYSATIRGEVVAYTFNNYATPDHFTQFYLNDTETLIDEATWDGHTEYNFEVETAQANLLEGENELFFVAHKTPAMTADRILFDWFEIKYARQFEATANQLTFSYPQGGNFQYQSHGFSNGDIQVYDITSPITPTRVLSPAVTSDGTGSYTVTFETAHEANARFLIAAVGDETVIQSPTEIQPYTPQDFSAIDGADYVLITHRDFMTATQTLADYRAAQGLSTLVIDIDELYNQFNFGIYNPIAIKNFLTYTFSNWNNPPSYAVLIGSGHWNMRGYESNSRDYWNKPVYMPPNLAFIDPWQGEVDSANLLATVVGEDILPDLAIGRIPIEAEEELLTILQKIMTFENASSQDWQRNLMFVADNIPDSAGDFVASNETIIQEILPPTYQPIRIYQNDYGCTSSSTTLECRAVTQAITRTLNITGALLVNYNGHGATTRWSGEQILRTTGIESQINDPFYNHLLTLENGDQPTIFVDMTCLTGYWIHTLPQYISLAVELLTLENGGAASTFSPTGLGVGLGHDLLLMGFYEALFDYGVEDLGGATLGAKLKLFLAGYSQDLIHTYTIFGDPALKIPIQETIFFPQILQ